MTPQHFSLEGRVAIEKDRDGKNKHDLMEEIDPFLDDQLIDGVVTIHGPRTEKDDGTSAGDTARLAEFDPG